MTDFSIITACGECCTLCPEKINGDCPGCIESDGDVSGWSGDGECRIHECVRRHNVRFCGLCNEFPCERMCRMIHWNENIVEHMRRLRDEYTEQKGK